MIREHPGLNATSDVPRNTGNSKQTRRPGLSTEEHLLLVFSPYAWLHAYCIYKQIPLFVLLASLSSTQHKTVSSLCINGVYCKKENASEVYNQSKRDLIGRNLKNRSRMEKFFYCSIWACCFIEYYQSLMLSIFLGQSIIVCCIPLLKNLSLTLSS